MLDRRAELSQRPSDAGGAPVQAGRAPSGHLELIGLVARPEPCPTVELLLGTNDDACDRFPRSSFAEALAGQRLVTRGREQHRAMVGASWRPRPPALAAGARPSTAART